MIRTTQCTLPPVSVQQRKKVPANSGVEYSSLRRVATKTSASTAASGKATGGLVARVNSTHRTLSSRLPLRVTATAGQQPAEASHVDRDVTSVLMSRRTINDFVPDRVPPPDVLSRALEAARMAPNHKMTEPWRLRILGPATVASVLDKCIEAGSIKEKKRERWAAIPGWLVVTQALPAPVTPSGDRSPEDLQAKAAQRAFRVKEDYAAVCCAIQNLTLSLWADGVGAKWTTGDYMFTEDFAQVIGAAPDEEEVVGVVWFGYSTKPLDELPSKPRRKAVDDILTNLP